MAKKKKKKKKKAARGNPYRIRVKNVALSILFLLRISKFVTTNRNPQ